MEFVPYFIYERGRQDMKNQLAVSVQSVLTPRGRVCFCVLADGKLCQRNGEEKAGRVATQMTKWFYQNGVSLFCRAGSKKSIYRSMVRELMTLHEHFVKEGYEREESNRVSVRILLLAQGYYISVWAGDLYFVDAGLKKMVFVRDVLRRGKKVKSMSFLGENRMGAIGYETGKCRRKKVYLIFSHAYEFLLEDNRLVTFLQTYGNDELMKRRLRELTEKMKGKSLGEDFACICVCVK